MKAKLVGEGWVEKRFESCFGDGQVWIGLSMHWLGFLQKQSLRQRLGTYNLEDNPRKQE